jgi:hypothetical protein
MSKKRKKSGERKEKMFDIKGAERQLGYMKTKYDIKYGSNKQTPQEYKKLALDITSRKEQQTGEEYKIKKLQKKITSEKIKRAIKIKKLQKKITSEKIKRAIKPIAQVGTAIKKGIDKISKYAGQKAISRGIIRKNQMVVKIPNQQPAPYVPIYFKQELEEARKSMFFQ